MKYGVMYITKVDKIKDIARNWYKYYGNIDLSLKKIEQLQKIRELEFPETMTIDLFSIKSNKIKRKVGAFIVCYFRHLRTYVCFFLGCFIFFIIIINTLLFRFVCILFLFSYGILALFTKCVTIVFYLLNYMVHIFNGFLVFF